MNILQYLSWNLSIYAISLETRALQRNHKDIYSWSNQKCWHFSNKTWQESHHFLLSQKLDVHAGCYQVLFHFNTAPRSVLHHSDCQEDFQSSGSLALDQFFKPSLACIVSNRWCITKIEPFRSTVTFLLLWMWFCYWIVQNISYEIPQRTIWTKFIQWHLRSQFNKHINKNHYQVLRIVTATIALTGRHLRVPHLKHIQYSKPRSSLLPGRALKRTSTLPLSPASPLSTSEHKAAMAWVRLSPILS